MEAVTLLLFCAIMVLCLVFNVSIILALLAGLLLFCAYARIKGNAWPQIFSMLAFGVNTAKGVLTVFVLIGMLTALWRACGTIPMIIGYAVRLINPGTLILMTFLLNCLISVLTGTAFGTAATMGVICMVMAASMQISPIIVGGAVISGAFFGDRCSPISTSALLITALTQTNIFDNIKKLYRSALIPTLLTCAIYASAGLLYGGTGEPVDLQVLFGGEFVMHWSVLLPAAAMLVLSALRIHVKATMSISAGIAALVCLFVQRMDAAAILQLMLFGFRANEPAVASFLNGGGVLSMLRVIAIVCISSAYSGIFRHTDILDGIKHAIFVVGKKITPFGAMIFTSAVTAMIACNQTLAIMLTNQLCGDLEPDSQKMAVNLGDTAVVIAPLVPWSIAGAVPLATAGAPTASLLAAFFLYLLPICGLIARYRAARSAVV